MNDLVTLVIVSKLGPPAIVILSDVRRPRAEGQLLKLKFYALRLGSDMVIRSISSEVELEIDRTTL